MNQKILIIEDEEQIADLISDNLITAGYETFIAGDGNKGLKLFAKENPDLIILDIMLPNIDGFSVCSRIRKKSDTPIIMLTARSDIEDQLIGYELKADDYITKPFNMEILMAKVKVMLDRVNASTGEDNEADNDIISINGLEINKLSRTVTMDHEIIDLERKQFDILLYLIENKNIVITRESLLKNIWDYEYFANIRVVDAQIKKLRKSLKHKAYLIQTEFGVGYKFETK